MTNADLQEPTPVPDSAGAAGVPSDSATVPCAVDPDDPDAVPAVLAAFVAAARRAHAVMDVNGRYPAGLAVGAIEDVVAATVRTTSIVAPYAGDYSSAGGKAMTRADRLLTEARSELSAARHHLCLDENPAR